MGSNDSAAVGGLLQRIVPSHAFGSSGGLLGSRGTGVLSTALGRGPTASQNR